MMKLSPFILSDTSKHMIVSTPVDFGSSHASAEMVKVQRNMQSLSQFLLGGLYHYIAFV